MSIRVSVLGSGSRGNATFIPTDKVRLLIDCGLGPRTLANRLRTIGEDPDQMGSGADSQRGLAIMGYGA